MSQRPALNKIQAQALSFFLQTLEDENDKYQAPAFHLISAARHSPHVKRLVDDAKSLISRIVED